MERTSFLPFGRKHSFQNSVKDRHYLKYLLSSKLMSEIITIVVFFCKFLNFITILSCDTHTYRTLFASSSSFLRMASLASPATRMLVTNSNPSCLSFVRRNLLSSICLRLLLNSSFTSFFSLGSSPRAAL